MLTADSILIRNGRVFGSDVAGEFVLLDQDNGQYYGFDAVASEIWRRLERPTKASQLSSDLTVHFAGDPVTIDKDVQRFLHDLLAEGLVTILDRPDDAASVEPSAAQE